MGAHNDGFRNRATIISEQEECSLGDIRMDWLLPKLAEVYIREIIKLYGVPVLIISDWDPRFTSRF
ncbi:Retrotransposon protein, Ty3-gypsy subclass [Gossypium australe]|uniref:Retrotransposon protein, Ty3-gypsy subclass n=1 Tax=Gossypium australe TaxID=47621 RepID=A0A5B6VBM5_9ROSI|nr:Retrotransposon protein, Ty3-gypsy subclass [Gossypium australe]